MMMPKIKIKNLSAEINRRIRLIKTPTSVVEVGEQNGAVDEAADYVGICLSPLENTVISCEGATTEINFPAFGGEWNVEFDGVLYLSDGSYMGPFLRSVFSDVIDANDDGFLRIANKDLLPHRIKFIPVQDTGYIVPSDNPTFMSHPDGSLTFCLSSSSSVPIGCAGAISTADTGGIWGNVTMTVNGVPYEAVMPIPDLMDVDNHGEELHNTFKNLSDQYVRVHITATELNADDHGWYENQNFTRSVDFNTGTIDFCLAPASCEPTEFVMTENNLFEGGSVRLDYVIDAPDHGISNVSKRFSMTDIAQGTYLSEIVRDVIAQIKEDHSFIAFREGTGNAVANFDYWTYRSTTDGLFRLSGITGVISNDPITIKFVKNNLNDDLFPLIFPNASADGLTEFSAHSCGTQELVGI